MEIYQVIGIALLGTAAAVLIRPLRPELGMMVALCCGVVVLFAALSMIEQIQLMLDAMLQKSGIDKEHTQILFKCLGICLVSQIASENCKDSGENAIATKVELVGKLSVLMISFPLFSEIFTLAIKLLEV